MISEKNEMTRQDWKKNAYNAVKFFIPAILIFLTALQNNVPIKEALYLLYLWAINVAIDAVTKFKTETKYPVGY